MQVLSFTKPAEDYTKLAENRKESAFLREVVAFVVTKNGKCKTPVTVRTYGSDARKYACIWIFAGDSSVHPETYIGAGGRATGGNYNLETSATDQAITRAGIKLDGSAQAHDIESAVEAIARYFYPDAQFLHVHTSKG